MKSRILTVFPQHLSLYACAVGFVVWWAHALLNHLFPPNDTLLDYLLYGIASICKLPILVAMPFFIRRVCRALDHNKPVLRRCVFFWSLALVALVLVLGWFHDDIVALLSNDAVRFYYVSDDSSLGAFHYLGRDDWVLRWQSGAIAGVELALGFALIGLISVVGYWHGKRKPTFLFVTGGLVVLLLSWPIFFGLLVMEYDFFLGGIFSDCVALDLMWPFTAMDPSSEVTFTVFLFFVASSLFAMKKPVVFTEE